MPSHPESPAPPGLGITLRLIGSSAAQISSLGLGTAALATAYGAPGGERGAPGRRAATRTIASALEAGITTIDTAPAYGDAEAIVGEACAGVDCQIATKLAIPAEGWDRLTPQAISVHVRRSVQRSLDKLRRSRIELLQIHNADAQLMARGEVTGVLEELRSEGVVLACGATVYGESNALAAIACPTFDAVQVAFSALDRRPERRLAAAAAAAHTALISRSILLRGILSPAGRSLEGPFAPLTAAADAFRSAAGASWEDLPGAALAFALSRPGITCSLVGPRDEAELTALLSGAARFAEAVRGLTGDWDRDLSEDLLDPSRWPTHP